MFGRADSTAIQRQGERVMFGRADSTAIQSVGKRVMFGRQPNCITLYNYAMKHDALATSSHHIDTEPDKHRLYSYV